MQHSTHKMPCPYIQITTLPLAHTHTHTLNPNSCNSTDTVLSYYIDRIWENPQWSRYTIMQLLEGTDQEPLAEWYKRKDPTQESGPHVEVCQMGIRPCKFALQFIINLQMTTLQ